jgi:hypothetical protein
MANTHENAQLSDTYRDLHINIGRATHRHELAISLVVMFSIACFQWFHANTPEKNTPKTSSTNVIIEIQSTAFSVRQHRTILDGMNHMQARKEER